MLDYDVLNEELKQQGRDFNRLTDPKGKPIEPKIRPLVIVLNYCGYKTTGSCEGHTLEEQKEKLFPGTVIIDEDEYQFVTVRRVGPKAKQLNQFMQSPYVDLRISNEKFKRLDSIIKDYSPNATVPWGFIMIGRQWRMFTEYTHTLKEMHASIAALAEYIYEHSPKSL